MLIFETISQYQSYLNSCRLKGLKIGFVPTMGALHEGHLSLLREAKKACDIVVCSIFVNPTQFDNPDDLKKYPNTIEIDKKLLKEEACDVLFSPKRELMYPSNTVLSFNFGDLEKVMEGKHRFGHFNGVALIVSKLLHVIQPDKAFFGEKDLQQCRIIETLVEDLFFNVEIIRCPIVRETNGLAKSSRNLRLDETEKQKATILYQSLLKAKQLLKEQSLTISNIKKEISQLYQEAEVYLEYFEIVDAKSLQNIESIKQVEQVAICVAAYINEIRLIDNLVLNEEA